MSNELKNYIQDELSRGVSQGDIKNTLEQQGGWSERDVQEVFLSLNTPPESDHSNSVVEDNSPEQKVKKGGVVKKIFLTLLGLIGVVLVFGYFYPHIAGIFIKDIGAIDDGDVVVRGFTVSESDNMFYLLSTPDPRSSEGFYVPTYEIYSGEDQDLFRGDSWNLKEVVDIISKNENAFSVFDATRDRSLYQYPPLQNPDNHGPSLFLPPLNALRELGFAQALRANLIFSQGDEKEGVVKAMDLLKFGQKLQDAESQTLVEYLVSLAVKNTAIESIFDMVGSATSTDQQYAIQMIKELERFKENENGLSAAFKAEYMMQKRALDPISLGETDILEGQVISKTSNFYLHPNRTLEFFADNTRNHISVMDTPCSEIRLGDDVRETISDGSYITLWFKPNAVGEILADVTLASLMSVHDKRCKQDFAISATQIAIAINSYEKEVGALPESLDDLAPTYFKTIPSDPFTGDKIYYDSNRAVVYSLGKNGIDDGGDEEKELDVVYNLNFSL